MLANRQAKKGLKHEKVERPREIGALQRSGPIAYATFATRLIHRPVVEGTPTRQDPVLSPKTLYRTAAPPSGYETENSTHYLKMACSELSSFIAISLIIKTTYRCHLTVK